MHAGPQRLAYLFESRHALAHAHSAVAGGRRGGRNLDADGSDCRRRNGRWRTRRAPPAAAAVGSRTPSGQVRGRPWQRSRVFPRRLLALRHPGQVAVRPPKRTCRGAHTMRLPPQTAGRCRNGALSASLILQDVWPEGASEPVEDLRRLQPCSVPLRRRSVGAADPAAAAPGNGSTAEGGSGSSGGGGGAQGEEAAASGVAYGEPVWAACRGSKPDSRGFTCGLWMLFHATAARCGAPRLLRSPRSLATQARSSAALVDEREAVDRFRRRRDCLATEQAGADAPALPVSHRCHPAGCPRPRAAGSLCMRCRALRSTSSCARCGEAGR